MGSSEITQHAQSILRSGANFQWYVIPLLALVMYIYANEYTQKNYRGIAAGLALYGVHWFYEILNALIKHFTGNALWTVPTGTSFLLLIGVGIELSLMFAVAGLVLSKFLPEDPKKKILGINNRVFFAIMNAAGFAIIEIFLASTPTFYWFYSWWGAIPVFITVYIPFFLAAFLCYDWQPKVQKRFLAIVWGIDAAAIIVFAALLHWI
jgi:hypothetical protein